MPISILSILQRCNISIDRGLSPDELSALEAVVGAIPGDLADLLRSFLPVGDGFPDWRRLGDSQLHEWINGPTEGILFDVEFNNFWHRDWGVIPDSLDVRIHEAAKRMSNAPRLIPLYRHRFLPSSPCTPGNPVFSIQGTDVIHYGSDIADYFQIEFDNKPLIANRDKPRSIEFWSSLTAD